MRVAMVSDVFFPRINGVSTAILTYRQSLLAHGIDVRLVAPDYGSGPDEPWIVRVPARSVPGDPEDRLVQWRGMHDAVEALVADGVDLVHVQTPFVAHYAGVRAARRSGVPVLATYHTLFEEYLAHYVPLVPSSWLKNLARGFSRRQCNAVDAVVVPSSAMAGRLGGYGVTTPMHILPTGIALSTPAEGGREAFRECHGIDPARPVALFVGRVAHEKNIDYLLDVVDLARAWVPDILLVIAGEGPALPSLRRLVAERGLHTCVQFIGYLERQNELPACYAAADVFVFASRTETQGLVLLEAMAAGLPVVSLAEMGTVDILGVGRGAVVPEDNPYAFALAVADLLRDPGIAFVVRSVSLEYLKPARLDEQLTVSLEVEKITRSQIFFRQHIRRASPDANGGWDELINGKIQIVCDLIRGKDVQTAMAILMQTPKAASEPLMKLLKSACANAENNFSMDPEKLVVTQVFATPGPILKRMMPRAQGRAYRINKRTSHVTLAVAEKE